MIAIPVLFAGVLLQIQVPSQTPAADPNNLPLGRTGTVMVEPGVLWDLGANRAATMDTIVSAAKGKRFVYVGENHATRLHQNLEAEIVTALHRSGRSVAVGLEMIQRTKQDVLDQWSAGSLTEPAFLEAVDWKTQWGYEYGYYRAIFEAAKQNKLPMIGLNVPRDWVRVSGRGGHAALPTSARIQLPGELYMGNSEHRRVFDSLMGGHPVSETVMNNMYSGQVLWDEGMADTAIKYLAFKKPSPTNVFVILAGSGHVMYGQGINYRINRRKAGNGLNIVMIQSSVPVKVSRGIGDFVFVSKEPPK